MISSGLPACMTFSSTGSRSWIEPIFWLAMRMSGSLEHGLHAVGVGDHVRRDVALVELHALDGLDVDAEGLATPRR